ncbi:MAG: T9SS type A sorting domain-containing protein [Ignavibacteriae bacterium]|nr:T9SS type A sorting domain-containing protein [Ignavibacteriota bacterium]
MRKIVLLIFLLYLILFSQNLFSQWTSIYTGSGTQHFEVFFTNPNTGWTGGDGSKVFKTTNCGLNWSLIFSPGSDNIYCMYFIDSSIGWAGRFSGTVLKTTNGGFNWSSITAASNKRIFDVFFINANTGWCVGDEGTLRKSTDGGNSWFNPSSNFFQYEAYSVYFLNAQTGFSCGLFNIAKTTDGGSNWNCIYNPQIYFRDLFFLNNNIGWAFGGLLINGNTVGLYVMKTINSGENWNFIFVDSLYSGYHNTVKESCFLNENLGYLIGLGGYMPPPGSQYSIMKKTTNGGINWTSITDTYSSNLEAIKFVNQQTGFVVGNGSFQGVIFKTTNGGVSFVSKISNSVPEHFSLSQNYPNPFNPITNIKFKVSSYKVVKLIVNDLLGREVQTLVNEKLKPGEYEISFNGSDLPSGVYFYSLYTQGNIIETKKMLMIK